MAYSFFESNTRFDVIGQINGEWVNQTSYDKYWNFYTSTEATPAPLKVESTSPQSSATLKSAKASFSTSNSHVVNFEATIGENEHAFAFGCDVKIRNNDNAPTTAIIASRTGSVKQMQLVDTGNLETAKDTDSAMVVKYTTIPTHFWIGKWKPRYYYATNDKTTSTCYTDNFCSWNDAGVCYQYQGNDSGMTVSWTNRNGGDTISFSFALGSVAETGAVTGKIDYSGEQIESLKANITYVIAVLDQDGNPITSKGPSERKFFTTYAGKVNVAYSLAGGHRFFANAGYFSDSPYFDKSFVAPRTRNTYIHKLDDVKSLSADVNYMYASNGYSLRLTGFYTNIADQTDVMSVYYDLNNSFGNFALSGIDERHVGMELGFEVPTPLSGLSVVGVFTTGEYVYTSTPLLTATVDNSAEPIYDEIPVSYWKGTPMTDGTTQKHYVPSTPQLAASLGLSYFYNYWFIDADVDYFANSYLDMSPLSRTDYATAGPDGVITPEEVEAMTRQEKFDPAWLVNFSVGKSWYYKRKYQYGFSLNAKNILNKTDVKTGGFEQTRMVDNTVSKSRYYNFDPKYFYMQGFNYMLNLYFRF